MYFYYFTKYSIIFCSAIFPVVILVKKNYFCLWFFVILFEKDDAKVM